MISGPDFLTVLLPFGFLHPVRAALRAAKLPLAMGNVSQLHHSGFAAPTSHPIQGILEGEDRLRPSLSFLDQVLLRRQHLESLIDLRDPVKEHVMSIRTGNRARHNRRLKKFARNRVRIRVVRAALLAAQVKATEAVTVKA